MSGWRPAASGPCRSSARSCRGGVGGSAGRPQQLPATCTACATCGKRARYAPQSARSTAPPRRSADSVDLVKQASSASRPPVRPDCRAARAVEARTARGRGRSPGLGRKARSAGPPQAADSRPAAASLCGGYRAEEGNKTGLVALLPGRARARPRWQPSAKSAQRTGSAFRGAPIPAGRNVASRLPLPGSSRSSRAQGSAQACHSAGTSPPDPRCTKAPPRPFGPVPRSADVFPGFTRASGSARGSAGAVWRAGRSRGGAAVWPTRRGRPRRNRGKTHHPPQPDSRRAGPPGAPPPTGDGSGGGGGGGAGPGPGRSTKLGPRPDKPPAGDAVRWRLPCNPACNGFCRVSTRHRTQPPSSLSSTRGPFVEDGAPARGTPPGYSPPARKRCKARFARGAAGLREPKIGKERRTRPDPVTSGGVLIVRRGKSSHASAVFQAGASISSGRYPPHPRRPAAGLVPLVPVSSGGQAGRHRGRGQGAQKIWDGGAVGGAHGCVRVPQGVWGAPVRGPSRRLDPGQATATVRGRWRDARPPPAAASSQPARPGCCSAGGAGRILRHRSRVPPGRSLHGAAGLRTPAGWRQASRLGPRTRGAPRTRAPAGRRARAARLFLPGASSSPRRLAQGGVNLSCTLPGRILLSALTRGRAVDAGGGSHNGVGTATQPLSSAAILLWPPGP
jgi:hypothetical protein